MAPLEDRVWCGSEYGMDSHGAAHLPYSFPGYDCRSHTHLTLMEAKSRGLKLQRWPHHPEDRFTPPRSLCR